MSKVIFKTREIFGEMVYETQYEFELYSDFIAYEQYKNRFVKNDVDIEIQVKEKENVH